MTDEQKALSFLKNAVIVWRKDNLTRAPEYEILKGGRTLFFRDGTGRVYETSAESGFINAYTEDYLNEALLLRKYIGKVMTNSDVQDFLESNEMAELRNEGSDAAKDIKIITATLAALGYDKNWLREVLESRLMESYSRI